MNTDLDLTITQGKASDIDTIVRFQADMAWLLKSTGGKPAPGRPADEPWAMTNVIR